MPRGVHDRHIIKSESDLERVWASVDDEGNELAHHVEPLAPIPQAFRNVEIPVGPVHVKLRLMRQTVLSLLAGMAGAGIVELIVHSH